jgi:hypothetical protein
MRAAHRVEGHYHSFDSGALRGMRGGGVTVIDVPQLGEVDTKFAEVVETERRE